MIKLKMEKIYKTFTGLFLLLFFFSFNVVNSSESLSRFAVKSSLQVKKTNLLSLDSRVNSSDSESTHLRKQEATKFKLSCCDYFSFSDPLKNVVQSKRLSLNTVFLSKPFLNLEILSSRCHPPTII